MKAVIELVLEYRAELLRRCDSPFHYMTLMEERCMKEAIKRKIDEIDYAINACPYNDYYDD